MEAYGLQENKKTITFLFIRHGETASNKEHRYLGRTDEPLSMEGREKLSGQKEHFPQRMDYLFISPMMRCRESAEILYPDKSYVVVPEWIEMDFGEFEGKNYEELSGDFWYQQWIDSSGTLPFPKGESRETFIKRVMDGFWSVLGQVAAREEIAVEHPNQPGSWRKLSCEQVGSRQGASCEKADSRQGLSHEKADITVACVVHGGTVMAICSRLLSGDYFDYQIKNGEYICITIS